jgi:hypothetical protein
LTKHHQLLPDSLPRTTRKSYGRDTQGSITRLPSSDDSKELWKGYPGNYPPTPFLEQLKKVMERIPKRLSARHPPRTTRKSYGRDTQRTITRLPSSDDLKELWKGYLRIIHPTPFLEQLKKFMEGIPKGLFVRLPPRTTRKSYGRDTQGTWLPTSNWARGCELSYGGNSEKIRKLRIKIKLAKSYEI